MNPKRSRRLRGVQALAPLLAGFYAAAAWAGLIGGSTSTTTTIQTGTTTTTLHVPVDVTGGGDFEGSFPAGSFDDYVFTLTEQRAMVAETTNGFGGCPGDTTLELRQAGVPGSCGGVYGDDLPCIAFNDDAGIQRCSLLIKSLPPGNYEVRVSTYGGVKLNRYFVHFDFVETECGNQIVEVSEQCDDGNILSGDCCSTSCQYDAAGVACNDGLFCNGTDTCNGSGACTQHSGAACPGPDGDSNCAETCSDAMGGCLGIDPNGSACDDGIFCNGPDACLNGTCSVHAGNPCSGPDNDGDCSETCSESTDSCSAQDPNGISCNDGLFCNGADSCQSGACSVHSGSPCPGPDGDGNCVESCNEAGDACTGNDANDSACNDGLFCNGADTCQGGVCGGHAGNPCPGADGDLNCSESCNEGSDACSASDPDGSPCNDGLVCNGSDSCQGGTCSAHAGVQCAGPDGDNDCAESCDPGGGCTGNDPNGSACNDGVFCNGADSCSNGSCSVHAGNPCPGPDGDGNCAESCDETADACTALDAGGSACNDGIFCNGADTCAGGVCSGHAGNPCPGPDGDSNCAETCNESADACSAADPAASPCNDGVFCNGADTCAGGSCSGHTGNPCPGADGDGNCSESCRESSDNCSAADPEGALCSDGQFCNGADSCASGACSVHVGSPCPGPDGDSNCVESCNEAADNCSAGDGNGAACNDGIFCNGADTCSGGSCSVHAGNPCPGADGDVDCSETCSETADACSANDPDGAACEDGLGCNGSDTCNAGLCDGHTGETCPGIDGDSDCSESCSDGAPDCTGNDPEGAPCDDGQFCNGEDTCSGGSCSVHAGSPCPGSDGDGNCNESCNEGNDTCTAPDGSGSPCSDGVFCNGPDACSAGACSIHAGNPCPGPDGDDNCAESCNEGADACTSPDANGAPCSNGLFCDGADACAAGACTTHAGDPCPGPDNDMNCAESCSEDSNSCTANDADESSCNDAVFCNGTDRCNAGICSTHAGNPCPGADGDANCIESCNEVSDKCTAPDPNGSSCDDGVHCNGSDQCASGACTQHTGNPCPGTDGDIHCDESCDEVADACSASDPDGSSCNDGLTCNGADTCSGGECEVHGSSQCPGADGDANCAESCSDSTGGCEAFDPLGSACDDGVFCNGSDSCSGGSCSVHEGNPCPGADGDSNCSESCDEPAGACTAPDSMGSPCSDGNPCTTNTSCNGAGLCGGGSAVECNDQDACTIDACVETGENCTHTSIPGCPETTTTLESMVCGDVSGDGRVVASDALSILRAAVGGAQCNARPCICDTNNSNTVTASDALIALRLAVGVPVTPLCDC